MKAAFSLLAQRRHIYLAFPRAPYTLSKGFYQALEVRGREMRHPPPIPQLTLRG